jgi:hypothetical protein
VLLERPLEGGAVREGCEVPVGQLGRGTGAAGSGQLEL